MIQAPIRRSLSEPTIGGDKGMMHSSACATRVLFSRYRHAGKERDTESGNDYFFARYYSSALGRFMSPDWSAKEDDPVPYADLDDPQSLNLYSYVRNNPMDRVDADGHIDGDTANDALKLEGAAEVVCPECTPAIAVAAVV